MSPFTIPPAVDYAAVFLFGMTGALAATRRGHDVIGLVVLAFAAGTGGGFLRDGLILQNGPPAVLLDGGYAVSLVAACAVTWVFHARVERFAKPFLVLDALGVAAYGVVGASKALVAGLSPAACVFTGVVNAVGGGMIRDVLVREEPLMLKPGQFYAVASAAGVGAFVLMVTAMHAPVEAAAAVGIAVTLMVRLLSIRLNWTTRPVRRPDDA